MITWYHATDQQAFDKIKQEGVLWGIRNAPSRCTYLGDSLNNVIGYGTIILQVHYDPTINPKENNYKEGCWQMRVYEPIPKKNIKAVFKL